MTIKNIKALMLRPKIAEIGSSQEDYQTDAYSGEILAGGNTFIFTEVDWGFRKTLTDKIQAEFEKQKGVFEQGKEVVLLGNFEVSDNGGKIDVISRSINGYREAYSTKEVGSTVFNLIGSLERDAKSAGDKKKIAKMYQAIEKL